MVQFLFSTHFVQVNKYHVRNHFSNYSNLLTYDTHGLVSYSDKFDRFKAAYDRVDKAAGLILNQSLPDGSFREALHDNDWDPTGDPQAQVVEYLSLDYEYNESPEVSSQLFTIANCNSTYFGFSRANFFATDQRGFNRFIHGQASEFLAKDDSRLLLNTVVTEISYDEDGVVITDARGGCINADYAITTFSVGVLQSGDVKFTPVLPQWKRTAIQTFEMGIYTKIFFQFPPDKVFWDTNIEYFLYASPTRGYYPVHQSLDHTDFHPESGLFLVTVVTEQSRIIERQDNETTKQQILAVLRQMFGEDKVPEPLDFMYPRWGMSPWAYGSYSNWPPGLTLKGHQNLRANVSRVWFAGEATSDEFYGYLQGAYFEGQVVGELVAACVNGTDPKCPGQKHYDTLSATSKKEDFGPENGWYKTSFQTLGDVDSGGSS